MEQRLWTKNFALLILGQASSLFGNFILKLALSMYVLDATGSAAIFAGILSAAVIPTILLTPFGGILADRGNKRNIMVALDAFNGIFVFCAAVFLSAENALLVIGALLVVLSVLGAFETPTVQACIPAMLSGDCIIKGNAVVNQVASVSYLIAPMLGSVLYTAFGLKFVMYASVGCFWITALFECWIKLDVQDLGARLGVFSMIWQDFSESMQFILKKQPQILKLLILAAVSRCFVMGITLVGLPYIIRTVLQFNARYYGFAESALAVATILGSILAGCLIGKLRVRSLFLPLAVLGLFIFAAGFAFLLPTGKMGAYTVNVAAFCGMQIAISVFSIFAVSMIQQRTPNHLIGKVMAYTSAITLCAQPIGQMVYGILFDKFHDMLSLVLIPTGVLVCVIGLSARRFFRDLEAAEGR